MKKKLKWIIPLLVVCLIVSGSLIYFYVIKEPTVVYNSVVYAFNIDNPREFAGFADYVFVGQVEEKIGTERRDDGPYTQYKVTVLNNLKGELITDKPIILNKHGGLIKEKNVLSLLEEDFLPEDGEEILPAEALSFTLKGQTLTAELTDSDGNCREIALQLRSGRRVA